jgi:Xaa-Pro aminopeptidase
MNSAKLVELRAEMRAQAVEAVIVPRADEHLGEYVPARAERLAWLTGFTGSAGLAAITANRAAVFSDGRYTLQLQAETDPALWERRHLVEEPPAPWLAAAGVRRVGYDPWLIAEEGLRPYLDAGLEMVPLPRNPVDAIWPDQPLPPRGKAVVHPLEFAGKSSADKRAEIAAQLRLWQQDAAVITDPASLAWLFNLRGSDVPFTPFVLGFALLRADASATLFIDPAKIDDVTRGWLGDQVSLAGRDALPGALALLRGKTIRVDMQGSPAWFAQTLRGSGANVVAGMDPCLLPKASKNAVEQDGSRAAHLRDGAAITRFLHWLDTEGQDSTECAAAARLLSLRGEMAGFRGESFPAITASGPHGAIVHYRATAASDRKLGRDEVYLIDSGGQYTCGTTDITRTIWTGPGAAPRELRERFTRVLRGHIAVARLVFPVGICGAHIDSFARAALWQAGLDYDHGTGHGVGSYLSVHEGPVSLSRTARPIALAPGMILSNEPGFYAQGAYGIRLENLVLVQPAAFEETTRRFLRLETLSLAPFDRRLLAPDLLNAEECEWLDAYHRRVQATLAPHLNNATQTWLAAACAPIAAGHCGR